jgi:uncharacterized protein YecE (DUF72 family)
MSIFRIGTSGYSYKHWSDGVFYPSGLSQQRWLDFYATHFDTVELNVTFYRQPTPYTFKRWRDRTPEGFAFTVKGSRYITHILRLNDPETPLARFFDSVKLLGEKLKIVLWQLPPGFKLDMGRLDRFCKLITSISPEGVGNCFEFRNKSWFCDEVYALLEHYGCHLCVADSPRYPSEEKVISNIGYLRLHGSETMYGYNYSPYELSSWAKRISSWKASEVYIYFNNDFMGYAVKNAMTLKEILRKDFAE